MAGQRLGDDDAVVSGGPRHPGYLAGGPQVSWGAAGYPRGAAHLESDAGPAPACALPRHGGWADPNGLLGGRPQRVFVARTGGHGGVSGQDGGGHPAALGAWRVGPARADATAAVAQPPAPLGPSEDEVECADHGALSPWRWCGDVSGALPAGRSDQERPPDGV